MKKVPPVRTAPFIVSFSLLRIRSDRNKKPPVMRVALIG